MMAASWLTFLAERSPELWQRTGEHLILTGLSTGAATLIGIPLGIVAARSHRLRGSLLGGVGILQTVPSLAMLAILLALLGQIGVVPALIALTLYALLPIVRNTLAGLDGIPPAIDEAARGIGMNGRQRLWMVEVPLALPVIVAGMRTAAVAGVGIATLSAFIGAGGLGQFINRGLALSNTRLILLGAIPAAILALIVDFVIGAAEWGLHPVRQSERGTLKAKMKPVALLSPALIVALGVASFAFRPSTAKPQAGGSKGAANGGVVTIGSKDFTEQFILSEMMAQMLERWTDLRVARKFNLGGTMICHGALKSGAIDLYPEYTGTALTAILKREVISDPDAAFQAVNEAYRQKYGAEWLAPFGFNNTYALTVRQAAAERNGWKTISDLLPAASRLRAGFTSEFAERPDGYPGLKKAYGIRFSSAKDLSPAIMYEALAKKQVDVICAFATDGRIPEYHLQPLRDDKQYFPPYQAAPVVRAATMEAHPEIRDVLARLGGLLDDRTMQQLNGAVDSDKRAPKDVVRAFLEEKQLL